jgi:hypothetical protein
LAWCKKNVVCGLAVTINNNHVSNLQQIVPLKWGLSKKKNVKVLNHPTFLLHSGVSKTPQDADFDVE